MHLCANEYVIMSALSFCLLVSSSMHVPGFLTFLWTYEDAKVVGEEEEFESPLALLNVAMRYSLLGRRENVYL